MKIKILLLLLLLLLPSFSLMLRHGIYTMHDFHPFRQQQFNKCIQQGIFPCRWAPDAGLGFGEPLFNFYAQFPYWLGQIFITFGFSIVNSVKILFILSLVASAIAMYFLARQFWGRTGAFISALFYVYAPYRAVDVWVRGALPEALSFVLFPFILLCFEKRRWWLLSLSIAALITTHNLSVLMFFPFMVFWWLFRSWQNRSPIHILPLFISGLFALLLSSYYLLPVIFESHLVTVNLTTQGYYNYVIHFTTLNELFVSRFWGYGASLWARKFLSVSAGHLQWIIPVGLSVFLLIKRKINLNFLVLTLLGFFALFLSHGKSALIWKIVPPMAYIQFPWRFLTISTFFLSLASGAIVLMVRNKFLLSSSLVLLLLLNVGFFRPDIWRSVDDTEQFSGALWDEQRSSALQDFWPKSAPRLPDKFAFLAPQITTENIVYPIVYFPGWKADANGQPLSTSPSGELGLLSVKTSLTPDQVSLTFSDTWPRKAGNLISLSSLILGGLWQLKKHFIS